MCFRIGTKLESVLTHSCKLEKLYIMGSSMTIIKVVWVKIAHHGWTKVDVYINWHIRRFRMVWKQKNQSQNNLFNRNNENKKQFLVLVTSCFKPLGVIRDPLDGVF